MWGCFVNFSSHAKTNINTYIMVYEKEKTLPRNLHLMEKDIISPCLDSLYIDLTYSICSSISHLHTHQVKSSHISTDMSKIRRGTSKKHMHGKVTLLIWLPGDYDIIVIIRHIIFFKLFSGIPPHYWLVCVWHYYDCKKHYCMIYTDSFRLAHAPNITIHFHRLL